MADRNVNARQRQPVARSRFDFVALLMLIAVGVYVAWKPGAVYAPAQRTMLFAVVALMVGISCGQQVAKVTINAGWLVASYGGTAAVVFGLVWFFTDLSKPDRQVAVYRVVTPSGDDYSALATPGVLQVETDRSGLTSRPFLDGSSEFSLVFPEQLPQLTVGVRYPPATGQWYWKTLTYAGTDGSALTIGKDLLPRGAH